MVTDEERQLRIDDAKDYSRVINNLVVKLTADLEAEDYPSASYDLSILASLSNVGAKVLSELSLSQVKSLVVPEEIKDNVESRLNQVTQTHYEPGGNSYL